jgi:ubiquinone/menaquinone biosynthesis C-methylase UbiE
MWSTGSNVLSSSEMTSSLSFDRAASIYDQTRPLPEPGATLGIQAILDIASPQARILDVGTGTGRVSIPLLQRGANLVGVDLSAKMLRRLQEKFQQALLAQADAAQLPFPTNHFDALLTIHVMHVVGQWRDALREFRRVLKPGGVYLNIRTYESVGVSVRGQVRDFWRSRVAAHGLDGRHPGVQNRKELLHELQVIGAHLSEVEAARFTHTYTLREELERFETRMYSDTWGIPDALFEATLQEVRIWVAREYGGLDCQLEEQVRFAIDVARFER